MSPKLKEESEDKAMTVVMVDVVDSSKGYAFDQSTHTKKTWELYDKVCNFTGGSQMFNTWGDGLVVSFINPMNAIEFVKSLYTKTMKGIKKYEFLKFRIAIHHDVAEIYTNPLTKRDDIIGPAVFHVARLEPVIYNGSTLVTEAVYSLIKDKFDTDAFTKLLPIKSNKNSEYKEARYFLDCCTEEAKKEIENQIVRVLDEQSINTKLWFELIEDAYNDGTDISDALDDTEEILIYFINGGETGKSLVDALRHRFRKLKQINKLKLKKITLATLKIEGSQQDKLLKKSGLLTNMRGTHKEMVDETRKRFRELVEKLGSDVLIDEVDIPWPPLGAILITDKKIYIRPSVYFEDVNHFPVICAGKTNAYYKKYSKALNEAIKQLKNK